MSSDNLHHRSRSILPQPSATATERQIPPPRQPKWHFFGQIQIKKKNSTGQLVPMIVSLFLAILAVFRLSTIPEVYDVPLQKGHVPQTSLPHDDNPIDRNLRDDAAEYDQALPYIEAPEWSELPSKDLLAVPPNYPAEGQNFDDELTFINRVWHIKNQRQMLRLILAVRIPKTKLENEKTMIYNRWKIMVDAWKDKIPVQLQVTVKYYDESTGLMPIVYELDNEAQSYAWVMIVPAFTYVHLSNVFRRVVSHVDPGVSSMYGLIHDENREVSLDAGIILTHKGVSSIAGSKKVKGCEKNGTVTDLVSKCWPSSGTQWNPMAGLHPYNQDEIMKKLLDMSIFQQNATALYVSVGGTMQAVSIHPLTFAKTTSQALFDAQLAVDTKAGKMPKILHHMWIGPRELRPAVEAMADACKKIHEERGWTYIRWSDETLQKLPGAPNLYTALANKDLVDPYHLFSDMMRLFILHKYGGVYMDIDAHCIQPLDPLVDYANELKVDFVAGLESHRRRRGSIANGVMLASPSSSTVSALITQAGFDVAHTKGPIVAWTTTGPRLLVKVGRHWQSWLNWKIISDSAFIPIHNEEFHVTKSEEGLIEYGRAKGSYTVQLFGGTNHGFGVNP